MKTPTVPLTGQPGLRPWMPGFAAACLVATILTGCHRAAEPAAASRPELPRATVRAQAAARQTLAANEEVVGTVRARTRATLEAKVSGRIEKLPVALGQAVKAGELIAQLDAAEIKARVDQAQANLEHAEQDAKRIATLFAQQAATRSELDAIEARRRAAAAGVTEARAMLAYVQVLAPYDGVITKKWAEAGDLAMPGKPLVDIEDLTALQLIADVPETLAETLKVGVSLGVRIDTLAKEVPATLVERAPAADPASRTVAVKLDLPVTAGLMPGQFARLIVPLPAGETLRVPTAALVTRGQLDLVFVVTNQHSQLRLVRTGRHVGSEVEILAGLTAGETVVTEGAATLSDQQPVEVK